MESTANTKPAFEEIDIKEIFHAKNPGVAKLIPGFVYRYLKRIAHQDFVNEIMRDYGHLEGWDFSDAMLKRFQVNINWVGLENLPAEGRYIFAANHPLGGFDGHIIMKMVGEKYGKDNYMFLVNDILMNLTNMSKVFLPVNKHGKQGVKFARMIDELYQSDKQVLTFPAGMVSRKIKGQIVDLEWQKNFITKARQYQRDIIPIHVSGKNTNWFYNLNRFRTFFGIKANIEMLYLIDETFRHQKKDFTITIGKPIKWETLDKSKKPFEWARDIKQKVYKLGGVDSIPL